MVETRGMKMKREEKQKTENCENKSETEGENGDDSNAINPLNMEDILHMVFLYLDIKSLKVVRQVNKRWEGLALRRMLKVGFFKLPEEFYKLSKEAEENVLEEIKPFISSNLIKILNVELKEEKDVEILSSLGILGPQVKQLKIKEYHHINNYEKLIMDQLVNLTHVTDSLNLCLDPQQLRLIFTLNNKTLVFPGLRLCCGYNPNYSDFLDTLENFANGPIKVKRLVFDLMNVIVSSPPEFLPRISRILNQILSNSSETLENICLAHAVGFLPDFEFPVLHNVKKLLITIRPSFSSSDKFFHQGLLLPPKFGFLESFPNLTQVELYCGAYGSEMFDWFDIWINSFKNSGIAPQVKTVWNFNYNNIKTDILSKVFPNARIK